MGGPCWRILHLPIFLGISPKERTNLATIHKTGRNVHSLLQREISKALLLLVSPHPFPRNRHSLSVAPPGAFQLNACLTVFHVFWYDWDYLRPCWSISHHVAKKSKSFKHRHIILNYIGKSSELCSKVCHRTVGRKLKLSLAIAFIVC